LVVALKRYVRRDHEADMRRWRGMAEYMAEELSKVPKVKVRVTIPDRGPRPLCIPRVEVCLDEGALGLATSEVIKRLKAGNPAVEVWRVPGQPVIYLNPQCLLDGEEKLVVERLKDILSR
ncbi:MAG: hypothetical protein QXL67_00300, partial [Candidatus Bathyarchaeia archaeon]